MQRTNFDSPLYVTVPIPPLICPSRLRRPPQNFLFSERLKTKSFLPARNQVLRQLRHVFIFSYLFSIKNEIYVFHITSYHTKIVLKITTLLMSPQVGVDLTVTTAFVLRGGGFLTFDEGTDRLSRNVGKKLPLLAA
jgi:hypothetical protein